MNTLNMKFVVVVICLAVCIGTTWCDVIDSAKATAGEVKDATAPTLEAAKDTAASTAKAAKDTAASTAQAAKDAATPAVDAATPTVEAAAEKSESFAQWAYDKISSGFGMKGENKPNAEENSKN